MIAIAEQIGEDMDLSRFFDETRLEFDLHEGVIWNPAKTRVCLLSTDLLSGIYKALFEEAGPAWQLIFKNCGLIWGERVARRLDRECQLIGGQRLGAMVLEDYLKFISNYFLFHGWGLVNIDISQARETGIVQATLKHSVFADVIKNDGDMADPMISGILGGMLKYISGHDLDCVQTACSTKGSDVSRFVISSRDRLKNTESMLKAGFDHQKFIETI